MIFRDDILWLLPATLIALYQVFFIWKSQTPYSNQDTLIEGEYDVDKKQELYLLINLTYLLLLIQLVVPIFSISLLKEYAVFIRVLGYILILIGYLVSFHALKTLNSNWTGMIDYRIKRGQILIQNGIYKYIRHPIYISVILELVGFELVANSWLALGFLVTGFYVFGQHVKAEEKLLIEKFGNKYLNYQKKTNKFIPYIW